MQSFDYQPYSDMEASFYHDNQGQREALKKMKSTMSLDFFGAPSTKKRATQTTQHLQPGILGSPDLNMLKLASPELERMIIQQNGMVTTTPTPSAITNPKFVTEEQEAYARGFVDALAELHEKQGDGLPMEQEQTVSTATPAYNDMGASMITTMAPMSSAAMTMSSATMSSAYNTHQQQSSGIMSMAPYGTPADQHQQQQQMMSAPSVVTSCADDLMPATSTHHQYTTLLPPTSQHQQQQQQQQQQQASAAYTNLPNVQENCRVTQLKQEEPQTVPNLGISFSPPVSPINMVVQEKIKLERKRERNRVAARKCRTRKLERISRLEDRVNDLKGQNTDLVSTATLLRDQVCKLKSQIMEHVKSGCQVMMSQNLL